MVKSRPTLLREHVHFSPKHDQGGSHLSILSIKQPISEARAYIDISFRSYLVAVGHVYTGFQARQIPKYQGYQDRSQGRNGVSIGTS